jgi:hypothetical protein
LYTEVQISGKISNDRAAQYWNDLETLHEQVKSHQESQEERIVEALRQEGARRSAVEGEIAGEVTRIRTDMQQFVYQPLPGWIQDGVSAGLRNLPPPPPTLTIEQIREVVKEQQPKINPITEKRAREKAYQKEQETFRNWMKEQMKEAEEAMAAKMATQASRFKGVKATPARREATGEERLSRWVSEVPPNLPELPRSPSPEPPI